MALTIAGIIWFLVIVYLTQSRLWLARPQISDDEHGDREAQARADHARFLAEGLDDAAMRRGRR